MTATPPEFRLYVAGDTTRSHAAARNLRRLLETAVPGAAHSLEIIDVLERPDLAEQERIIATPLAVRVSPPPARYIVGDISDPAAARTALDLDLLPKDVTS